MKFSQILDTNMVPEWRNQYLDYRRLDGILQKAIGDETLNEKRGIESYCDLIKANQMFASYFSGLCVEQLDKINAFQSEKLLEMQSNYNNLHDQLDQVISSAVYKEIQCKKWASFDTNHTCAPTSGMMRLDQLQSSLSNSLMSLRAKISRLARCCRTSSTSRSSSSSSSSSSSCSISTIYHPSGGHERLSESPASLALAIEDDNDTLNIHHNHLTPVTSAPSPASAETTVTGSQSQRATKAATSFVGRSISQSVPWLWANSESKERLHKMVTSQHSQANSNNNNNININPLTCSSSSSNSNSNSNSNSKTKPTKSKPKHKNSITSFVLDRQLTRNWSSSSSRLNMNHHNEAKRQSQALIDTNYHSKKKIVSFYKKKMSHLKFAFSEFYFSLVLFEQYIQLNYAGFERLLRKHDRMFASTWGRKFYEEHVQTADFYTSLQSIDTLIEGVEHVYTLHFENGNRRKAIEKLSVPANIYKPTSAMLDFRVGLEIGALIVLFALTLLVGFLSNTGYDWRTVFRLYRSPLLLIIFLFQTGISIIIWKHYKINHVLIFELDPRNNLSFQHFHEFASLLGIIWCLSVLLFLFSESLNIPPSLCPLVVVGVIAGLLLNPLATGYRQARFWLLRILGRILTAPLNSVRFADFWVADQLVSIVPFFLDLEYLSCFYMSSNVLAVEQLNAESANRCVTRNPQDLVIRTIVAALPAWFRCAQCLRRWYDENWLTLHLANAIKYGCMVSVVCLSSISQFNKDSFELDTMRIVWLVAAIFTSCFTAYWDIIYDFGLFNTYDKHDDETNDKKEIVRVDKQKSLVDTNLPNQNKPPQELQAKAIKDLLDTMTAKINKKRKTWPFLRKELIYPVWVYYFAIIENWILRFGWVITISLTEFSGIEAGLVLSILAPLEMFRRFVWNCIRLENEQLNNCGLFRAVRDIPFEVLAPVDESHLDRIIMLMDSPDGPAMRNRIMKRRSTRSDGNTFILINESSVDIDDHKNNNDLSLNYNLGFDNNNHHQ